jgi:multidrug resistance efflux pump
MCLKYLAWLPVLAILVQCKQKAETISPAIESITESVYASGIVKSKNQYNVYATVTGTIEEILVKEGDFVKAGQPLLRLKSTTALLSSENARLTARFAEINQNRNKLAESQLAMDLAKAKLLNDSLLMIRQNSLYEQSIGTKVEWEQRKLAYENSATAYQSARIRYTELQRQLNLSAEQARLNAEIASNQLQDFTVTSNVDGRLYWLQKETGELVTPQTYVAIVGDADRFLLELEIDETDIARVAVGQRVVLTLSSYPNQLWEGRLGSIKPLLNERSKLFTLEADFLKTPPALYPNLTAEANIIIQSKEKALTIPRVYLVNDSTVQLQSGETRTIKIGLRDFQKAEIVSGLQASDVLVKPVK